MREEVVNFCEQIGNNPLLVQGAGGNVSWKDGKVLYVKASGTWLAHAKDKNIFVAVDGEYLRKAIERKKFDVNARVLNPSDMKPSIETMLHAVMLQRIVVHLHLVNVVAWMVRKNCHIKHLLKGDFAYTVVNYHKPGAELARAVHSKIKNCSEIDVVFLKNHGVIVGGDSIDTVSRIVKKLDDIFCQEPRPKVNIPSTITPPNKKYHFIACQKIQQLVFDNELFQRISKDWAIYPDHIVFLGGHPYIYHGKDDIDEDAEIIFLKNRGVFARRKPTPAQMEQLLCYYNILTRERPEEKLVSLSSEQIADILNWDAEHYRRTL